MGDLVWRVHYLVTPSFWTGFVLGAQWSNSTAPGAIDVETLDPWPNYVVLIDRRDVWETGGCIERAAREVEGLNNHFDIPSNDDT